MDDTQAALPPLPDPDDGWHSYTAEQMREYAMAAATEAGMRAFEEGWNKHKSLAATAPAGEPAAWMTMTEEGDPAMLFFDRAEAVQYCDDGEQPTPLYEAAPAATPSSYPGIPDNSSAAALGSLHAVACRLRLSGVDDDIAASLAQQISDAAAALSAATPSEDARDAARYRWLRSQHEVDDERASDNNYGKSYPPRSKRYATALPHSARP